MCLKPLNTYRKVLQACQEAQQCSKMHVLTLKWLLWSSSHSERHIFNEELNSVSYNCPARVSSEAQWKMRCTQKGHCTITEGTRTMWPQKPSCVFPLGKEVSWTNHQMKVLFWVKCASATTCAGWLYPVCANGYHKKWQILLPLTVLQKEKVTIGTVWRVMRWDFCGHSGISRHY